MSDLISRSDVIQILKECNLDETLFEKDVFDKIRNLPTAYDVDKVIKRLKKLRDCKYLTGITNNAYEFGACDALNDAIKIIKAGGNIELPEHSKSQSD
jgi:hypothetical protein|nr:MAG TPA: hypothetical protein [Caudoviricetes sp.]